MRFFAIFLTLLLSAMTAHSSDTVSRHDDDAALFERIKKAVTPMATPSGDIEINHPFETPPLDIKLGEAIKNTDIKSEFAKPGENISITTEDLLEKAYYAANVGSLEAAAIYYQRALKSDEKNINALFGLGSVYQKLHQYSEAKAQYLKILKIEPDNLKTVNNYIALISEESPASALQKLRALEATNPNYIPVKAQLGLLYFKLGENDLAESYLRKSVALAPDVSTYRYNLALFYDKVGDINAALISYRQFLELFTSEISADLRKNLVTRINSLQNSRSPRLPTH